MQKDFSNLPVLARSRLPVRWGDMDAMGHMNNTVYFRFMEQVRIEWFGKAGLVFDPKAKAAPVVVHVECAFIKPITYPATVDTVIYLGERGGRSIMTYHDLIVDGEVYAQGSGKIVWFSPQTGRSVDLPPEVAALFS